VTRAGCGDTLQRTKHGSGETYTSCGYRTEAF